MALKLIHLPGWTPSAIRIYQIACLITITMLIFGLQKCQHDFYAFVRLFVWTIGAWGGCRAALSGKRIWAAVLVIMACLFNPIWVIHLPRHLWLVADLLAILLVAASAIALAAKQMIIHK